MGILLTGISFTIGFTLGQQYTGSGGNNDQNHNDHNNNHNKKPLVLPNGLPRTCCDTTSNQKDDKEGNNKKESPNPTNISAPTTDDNIQGKLALLMEKQQFLQRLRRMIGKDNVMIVDDSDSDNHEPDNKNTNSHNTQTAPYLKGARIVHVRDDDHNHANSSTSQNHTIIIVTPKQLHHVVSIIEACVQLNTTSSTSGNNSDNYKTTCTVIPQGQNTGLTGGSTPRYHHHYDHQNHTDSKYHHQHFTILLSLKHLNAIFPMDDGQRVCCMAGVGLASVRLVFVVSILPFSLRYIPTIKCCVPHDSYGSFFCTFYSKYSSS